MSPRRDLAAGGLALVLMTLAGCGAAGPQAGQPLRILGIGRLFNYPRAIARAADGTLYVVDKAGVIRALDPTGRVLRRWRMPAIDAGKPTGLSVGPDGNIYAADTHYARIVVFAPDGRLLRTVGSKGDGPGQFRLPTDVAFDADGFIYVSEYGGHDRISRFTPDWRFVSDFGTPDAGEAALARPQCIVVSRVDQTLWVADACNHRIVHFDRQGRFLGAFGRQGDGPGELQFPYGIAELSDGTLVVCEYGNNRVQRFDRRGRSLGIWGSAGREPGQLAYPWALVADERDRVYIVDSGNDRVQVIAGGDPRTWRRPPG